LQCLSALMGPRSVETTYDVRDLVVRWNKPEATIFDYGGIETIDFESLRAFRLRAAGHLRPRSLRDSDVERRTWSRQDAPRVLAEWHRAEPFVPPYLDTPYGQEV
jgi:hypothetical protein